MGAKAMTPAPLLTDVVIIDDDRSLAEMLSLHLDDRNLTSKLAHTGTAGKDLLSKTRPRLLLLDQHLPDTTGLALIPWVKTHFPDLPILMITGMHDMELAIAAIKAGAEDYIHKPIDTAQLDATLTKLLGRGAKTAVSTPVGSGGASPKLVGTSQKILEVTKNIAVASQSDATVLLTGESGTGKELVARAIHQYSGKAGAFVAINCAAIVDTLMESELFGHEKGAFTGAVAQKEGKFAAAWDGTLFLDEIGEMSTALQAKLLRVLQEGTYERVGGTQTLTTNARIIAATHRHLPKLIAEGKFREDLFYRLRVIDIHIPPLRDRKGDLEPLISHLLQRINAKLGKNIKGVDASAMALLTAHDWPGNVRELENTLTRAAALARRDVLDASLIELEGTAPAVTGQGALLPLEEVERQHVLRVLAHTGGHRGQACDILGISRPALERRIQKYGYKD
jgi:DNA-binding NtrC family response regulator